MAASLPEIDRRKRGDKRAHGIMARKTKGKKTKGKKTKGKKTKGRAETLPLAPCAGVYGSAIRDPQITTRAGFPSPPIIPGRQPSRCSRMT
jgi:hypothetical protein